jgi:phenylacetate-CoA ligase
MLTATEAFRTLWSLTRHAGASRLEIVAFRNRRLRQLVEHAYARVPYYTRLFDRDGLRPNHIRTVEDLAKIPITSRCELQDVPPCDIVAQGIDPASLIPSLSSGSSGRPLTVRRSWMEERLHNAYRWRALASYGLRATDVHLYVTAPKADRHQDNRVLERAAGALGIGRTAVISCFESPDAIVQIVRATRPGVVSGYANALARLARSVDPRVLRGLGLRFVGTGGEVLTADMRRSIEEAFSAPVYDTYASVEFNVLAWQCRTTGDYHACDDGTVMEVLRNDTPAADGERGELVGTNLLSHAMPLIRYRLGDLVVKGCDVCPCGRPFSTIRSIQGRMIDRFVLPDGRTVHPYEFGLIRASWIREFQVMQEEMDLIRLRIIAFHRPSSGEIQALLQPIVQLVGEGVKVKMDLVDRIPVETSGKFRVYRSLVRSAYDGCEWPETSSTVGQAVRTTDEARYLQA